MEDQRDLTEIMKVCCNKPKPSSPRWDRQILKALTVWRVSDTTDHVDQVVLHHMMVYHIMSWYG